MATSFPTSIDSLTDPISTNPMTSPDDWGTTGHIPSGQPWQWAASSVASLMFIQRSGSQLTLNGLPFHFTSFNMPYIMHPAEGNSYLSTALADINPTPNMVFRVFCFQTYNIVSGAVSFTQLDAL